MIRFDALISGDQIGRALADDAVECALAIDALGDKILSVDGEQLAAFAEDLAFHLPDPERAVSFLIALANAIEVAA